MKKIFLAILVTLSAVIFSYAESNKIVGFNIGLSSGIPVYDGTTISDQNELVNDGNFNRIIIGPIADINFRLSDILRLVLGMDVLCDFIWNRSDYSNHIDYAFHGGIKVYPGFEGLNASVAYAYGRRTDFLNNNVQDSIVYNTSWGNGFRFGLEYDFQYNSSYDCMPAVGFYYRRMPRGGNEYDNIFAVYVNLSM